MGSESENDAAKLMEGGKTSANSLWREAVLNWDTHFTEMKICELSKITKYMQWKQYDSEKTTTYSLQRFQISHQKMKYNVQNI